MDQLKDFLKQCVKYRFWIAFGVSLLLPIIGYFVGSGAIIAETNNREKAIKDAKTEIGKYTASNIINDQYKPEAEKKKDVLTQDVNATWRKLYASQAPLLRWPSVVEERFRSWGRKYPEDIDRNQVQSTIIDYTIAYPEFVSRIYKTFKPINFDEGGGTLTGIVVAPDEKVLLAPAPFSQDSPPELGKVWAEQERLWVVTALLDVVAKVNDGATAKDWDGAIIKQLNLVEVGSPNDQDQVSLAKGEPLVPAEALSPPGAAAPAAPAAPGPGGPEQAGQTMGMGAAAKTDEVFYLKTEGQQFKILPVKMNVLVDQARLQDFLVGLENSPMAIQVMEIELAKPITPVVKPTYGDRSAFNFGGMMGGEGYMMMGGPGNRGGRPMSGYTGPGMAGGGNMRSGDPGMGPGMAGYPGSRGGMSGYGGGGPVVKKGTDIRSINKAEERKKKDKEASKAKADTKNKVDQYFNVIEVTVYGQARFYLSPPPSPQAEPSTSAPAPDAAPAPAAEAAKEEAPKPEAAAPKGDAPVADPSAPKADPTSPDASKAGSPGPKP